MKHLFPFLLSLSLVLACQQAPPTEYILQEIDLLPEGIAYSSTQDAFYLSSIYKSKIIKVDRQTGDQEDFISEQAFGYLPGVGIMVDDEKGQIHALGGYFMGEGANSAMFSFDLGTQELIRRIDMPEGGGHFLNDMAMDRAGNLYLTNTKDSSIYYWEAGSDSLHLFFQSTEIQYPNGIAISDDESKLYIASFSKGIRILDMEKKILLNEVDSSGMSRGIDGLEFYQGHLYAVQNGGKISTHNFRKLLLNAGQDRIVGAEVIAQDVPYLNVPLTFCIAKEKAIVIGNSNLQYLEQENFLFTPSGSTEQTRLLTYDLP
ncbi:MAG: SMP-30/gluconolactonase/LRE family protein [Bacteroidota bacterium]